MGDHGRHRAARNVESVLQYAQAHEDLVRSLHPNLLELETVASVECYGRRVVWVKAEPNILTWVILTDLTKQFVQRRLPVAFALLLTIDHEMEKIYGPVVGVEPVHREPDHLIIGINTQQGPLGVESSFGDVEQVRRQKRFLLGCKGEANAFVPVVLIYSA